MPNDRAVYRECSSQLSLFFYIDIYISQKQTFVKADFFLPPFSTVWLDICPLNERHILKRSKFEGQLLDYLLSIGGEWPGGINTFVLEHMLDTNGSRKTRGYLDTRINAARSLLDKGHIELGTEGYPVRITQAGIDAI